MEWALLIVFLGLFFDYTNGFHDAANVVSTVIATKALTPIIAIILAGILNALGATQVSGVAQTIAEGLFDPKVITEKMIVSSLLGAIFWNLFSWYFGLPSSSSYALIGGLVGSVWMGGGIAPIYWSQLIHKVIIPMFFSPIMGFFLALGLMKFLLFLGRRNTSSERVYRYLQIGSASIVALAHGMNDAQKSMGVITLGLFSTGSLQSLRIPLWVILACAFTMGCGTAWGGWRIIRTVSYRITDLVPSQGFAAETSTSVLVLIASFFGIPLSSTQIIIGCVTGVGAAKGKGNVHWDMVKQIRLIWVFTIPGSAIVSALVYKLFSSHG